MHADPVDRFKVYGARESLIQLEVHDVTAL